MVHQSTGWPTLTTQGNTDSENADNLSMLDIFAILVYVCQEGFADNKGRSPIEIYVFFRALPELPLPLFWAMPERIFLWEVFPNPSIWDFSSIG